MRLLIAILGFLLISCQNENNNNYTYVGGQIVNPVDSLVTISYNKEPVQTININKEGVFSSKITIEKEGIYTFSHLPEWQLIYLKPKDSIGLRVNTKAFDESLTFSGSSAPENNFLINMYLMNEKNNDLILSYYKIKPFEFAQKTDSIKQLKLERLEQLNKQHQFSDFFLEIANKSISYEFYDMRERYAFLIRKYFPERSNQLKPSFFDYREGINFNDESMLNHIGYMRFLDNYLKNKSIEICSSNDIDCFKINSFSNLKIRLKLADSTFSNSLIRNKFYKRFLEEEILYASTKGQLEQVKTIITNCSLAPKIQKDLTASANLQAQFLVGRYVGDDQLITTQLDTITIKDLLKDRPLVVTTWSNESSAYFNLHKSILKDLKYKYPDIRFLGINIDYLDKNKWLGYLKNYRLDFQSEFNLDYSKTKLSNEKYLKNHTNRLFMITKKGYLTSSNVSFSDRNLESKLVQLLN